MANPYKKLNLENTMSSKFLYYIIWFGMISVIHNPALSQTVKTLCTDGSLKSFSSYDFKTHADLCTDGTRLTFDDSSGNIVLEIDVRDCRIHGLYKRFYKNGLIREIRFYKAGKKNGDSYFWNERGVLVRTEKWINGKRVSKKINGI